MSVSIVDETEERTNLQDDVDATTAAAASLPMGSESMSESHTDHMNSSRTTQTSSSGKRRSKGIHKSISDILGTRRVKSDRKTFERTATGGSAAVHTSSTSTTSSSTTTSSTKQKSFKGNNNNNNKGWGSNRFKNNTSFVRRKQEEDDEGDDVFDDTDFDIPTARISTESMISKTSLNKNGGRDSRTRHSFWKTKSQVGAVDQSVNLMDAENGKYERESTIKKSRKSFVDIFLQDSDHDRMSQWGNASLDDSLDDLNKKGSGNQGGCRRWIIVILLLLLIIAVFVIAPTFGVLALVGDKSPGSTSTPTASPTLSEVVEGGDGPTGGATSNLPASSTGDTKPMEEHEDPVGVDTETDQDQAPTLLDIIMPQEQPVEIALTEETLPEQHPNLAQVPHTSAIEAFRFYIVDQDISEEAQLDIMGSPTKKALHWITQQDHAKLPIPGYNLEIDQDDSTTTKEEYALLQRYALAVFYYSQHQTSSATATARTRNAGRRHLQQSSSNNDEASNRQLFDSTWLSADPVCTWCGVVCDTKAESVLEVNLPHHLLQGTIPREFLDGAAMPFLTHVDLTGNQLHGQLPQVTQERDTVGQQLGVEPLETQLRVLKLGQNQISGNLDQVVGLTQLKEVDLSQNQITGKVPDSIVDLHNLGTCIRRMCVCICGLCHVRSVPRPLMLFLAVWFSFSSQTHSSETLNLSHNQLSGELPSKLGDLVKLKKLLLEGNKLSGQVPEELCALRTAKTLQSLETDCAGGGITCDCCTACSFEMTLP